MKRFILLLGTLMLLIPSPMVSQNKETLIKKELLSREINRMDSLLFNIAFNKCDLTLFKKLMANDFEFYDDRSGLNTSIDKEIRSFKDRCSKPYTLIRKLTKSEVNVLGDYGAVQTGNHEFYINNLKVEKAKFITIWERKNNSWVVKRAISYQHQAVENEN